MMIVSFSETVEFSPQPMGKHSCITLRQAAQPNAFDDLVHSFRGFGFNDDRTPEQSSLERYFRDITQLNFMADGVKPKGDPLKDENAVVIGMDQHGSNNPGEGITSHEHSQTSGSNGEVERREFEFFAGLVSPNALGAIRAELGVSRDRFTALGTFNEIENPASAIRAEGCADGGVRSAVRADSYLSLCFAHRFNRIPVNEDRLPIRAGGSPHLNFDPQIGVVGFN